VATAAEGCLKLLASINRAIATSNLSGPHLYLIDIAQLNVSPAISAIIPSHVGGYHIPDIAYTACGADVRILQ
jgi:hypothetical protein